jgi:hypothetical protein
MGALPASTISRSRSTLPKVPVAASTIARVRGVLARWMPGVSRNINWPGSVPARLRIPMILLRVVWGLWVVMAIFSPTIAFRSVDLPTLGLPMMLMNPERCMGSSLTGTRDLRTSPLRGVGCLGLDVTIARPGRACKPSLDFA